MSCARDAIWSDLHPASTARPDPHPTRVRRAARFPRARQDMRRARSAGDHAQQIQAADRADRMKSPVAFLEESLFANVRQSAEKRIGSISLSRGWLASAAASIDALVMAYMVVQTRCGRVPRLRVNPLDNRCFFRTGAVSLS